MKSETPNEQALLEFQKKQGEVPVHEAMLAWNPKTKAFAIVRHPVEPVEWEQLDLSDTHGACWHNWARAEGETEKRATAELLGMLNAEVLAILLRCEADPSLTRQALGFVPEWNEAFGDNATWPYAVS